MSVLLVFWNLKHSELDLTKIWRSPTEGDGKWDDTRSAGLSSSSLNGDMDSTHSVRVPVGFFATGGFNCRRHYISTFAFAHR